MRHTVILHDPNYAISQTTQPAFSQNYSCIDEGRGRWRHIVSELFALQKDKVSEQTSRETKKIPFYQQHMALVQALFRAQQRFSDFLQFYGWLKLGAGYVDWVPGPQGEPAPLPKSLGSLSLDDVAMREIHTAMLHFVQRPVAIAYLWPEQESRIAAANLQQLLSTDAPATPETVLNSDQTP